MMEGKDVKLYCLKQPRAVILNIKLNTVVIYLVESCKNNMCLRKDIQIIKRANPRGN